VILVPYTVEKLNPETKRLVEAHTPPGMDVEWAELDSNHPGSYARLLVEVWAEPGDLLIIEHDIGIRAGVIEELLACTQSWCGFPYTIGEQLLVCLGCTRFTAHLKASLPGLMAEAAAIGSEQDGGGVAAGDWRRMDVRIAACLEKLGHQRHPHLPAVDHFHHYPAP
jgi:hypothetical protein